MLEAGLAQLSEETRQKLASLEETIIVGDQMAKVFLLRLRIPKEEVMTVILDMFRRESNCQKMVFNSNYYRPRQSEQSQEARERYSNLQKEADQKAAVIQRSIQKSKHFIMRFFVEKRRVYYKNYLLFFKYKVDFMVRDQAARKIQKFFRRQQQRRRSEQERAYEDEEQEQEQEQEEEESVNYEDIEQEIPNSVCSVDDASSRKEEILEELECQKMRSASLKNNSPSKANSDMSRTKAENHQAVSHNLEFGLSKAKDVYSVQNYEQLARRQEHKPETLENLNESSQQYEKIKEHSEAPSLYCPEGSQLRETEQSGRKENDPVLDNAGNERKNVSLKFSKFEKESHLQAEEPAERRPAEPTDNDSA